MSTLYNDINIITYMDPCCSSNNVNSCSGGVGAEGGDQGGGEGGGGGGGRGGDRSRGQSRSVSNSVKGVRHSSHVETKVRPPCDGKCS